MEREYGRAYEQLYWRHWWWRAREEYLVSLLKKTPLPAPTTILDVGCGGGWFFDRLSALGGQVEIAGFPCLLETENRGHLGNINFNPFVVSY